MKAMIFDGKRLKEVDYKTDSYDFISTNVGGYIERIPIRDLDSRNIDMWCNEDGKFTDLQTSIVLAHDGKAYDFVVGNVVFTKNDDGETTSLTDDDVKFIKNKFDHDGYYIDMKTGLMTQVLNFWKEKNDVENK